MRIERDALGEVEVPDYAYWGAQTQRAVGNFQISGEKMPATIIKSLGHIKKAAALVHMDLDLLDKNRGTAIIKGAEEVISGELEGHFPVDVFQTGSGTSTNMNVNEVIARRAGEILGEQKAVHPNDHVNMGQSSNDVFPSAVHLAILEEIENKFIPAMVELKESLEEKGQEFEDIIKLGRTHYQDAVPVSLGQEFMGFSHLVGEGLTGVKKARESLYDLPLGGTAVGTGLNTHPDFAHCAIKRLKEFTGFPLKTSNNYFAAQGARGPFVEMGGSLKEVAVSLRKIADDLRWMAAGPRGGPGEIKLPELQPGSSIMPGKVNPVLCEVIAQISAQVIGNEAAITIGGFGGHMELNLMLPLMARNLLSSVNLLASGSRALSEKCVAGIEADEKRCREVVERSFGLVTALVPYLGYDQAALIAQKAYQKDMTIREVLYEKGLFSPEEIDRILNPDVLAWPHGKNK